MKQYIKESLRRHLTENEQVTGKNLADALKQFGLTDTTATVNISNEKTGKEDVLTVVADENGNLKKGGLKEISTLGKIVISCVIAATGLASCTKENMGYSYNANAFKTEYKKGGTPNKTIAVYSGGKVNYFDVDTMRQVKAEPSAISSGTLLKAIPSPQEAKIYSLGFDTRQEAGVGVQSNSYLDYSVDKSDLYQVSGDYGGEPIDIWEDPAFIDGLKFAASDPEFFKSETGLDPQEMLSIYGKYLKN